MAIGNFFLTVVLPWQIRGNKLVKFSLAKVKTVARPYSSPVKKMYVMGILYTAVVESCHITKIKKKKIIILP